MFWAWLILVDFLVIALLSTASSLLFARALLLLRRLSAERHGQRMAPSFIAFMAEMTLLSLALAVNGFIMLINWHRGKCWHFGALFGILMSIPPFLFRWLQQRQLGVLV